MRKPGKRLGERAAGRTCGFHAEPGLSHRVPSRTRRRLAEDRRVHSHAESRPPPGHSPEAGRVRITERAGQRRDVAGAGGHIGVARAHGGYWLRRAHIQHPAVRRGPSRAWLRIKVPKGESLFKTLHSMKINPGEAGGFVDASQKPGGDRAVAVGGGLAGAQRTFRGSAGLEHWRRTGLGLGCSRTGSASHVWIRRWRVPWGGGGRKLMPGLCFMSLADCC